MFPVESYPEHSFVRLHDQPGPTHTSAPACVGCLPDRGFGICPDYQI